MHHLIKELSEKFHQAILSAFPELESEQECIPVEIVQATQKKFGDYQCNTPMKLAKKLKENPRKIAEKVIKHVDTRPQIDTLAAAGPGFINIAISPAYLSKALQEIFDHPHLGIDRPARKQRIIVEFSSPNIAKELHVGHLRSTIIGDCLARVFEFLGHDVLRLNHVGDWGTAFGMLIAYLKEEHPAILTEEEETDLSHLVRWYRESKQRFDENDAFKKRAQLEVVDLQGGKPDTLKAWQRICTISRKAYDEIYALLDVKLTERGESFYNPLLPDMIADLESKRLITISDGARCLFLEEFKNREGNPMPLMMQKSDGGYGYDTTDMAGMRHRTEEEKADRIIVVTDAGQSMHFQMIHSAAIKAGYIDPKRTRFDHVPFGLVLAPDGKKFRTRSGETERLIDLLYTAIAKAEQIMKERNPQMDQEERKTIAKALGIGAVKYADLSCHRTGDYTFSYDRMLRFEGNTAAYLLYAYVRISGIKRKIRANVQAMREAHRIDLEHPSEAALGMKLLQFAEALDQVANDLLPNRLTDYLYGLTEAFNAFYRDCQVEGDSKEGSRLLLCEIAARTMKQGLNLLGVETVDRM
ncbi:MAG: arginine--tRNA ligase [Waddliaceae bacterium]